MSTEYEPAENSAAKDVVMVSLEKGLTAQGVDPYADENDIDLIELSDAVVESLLEVGVEVPTELTSPFLSKEGK